MVGMVFAGSLEVGAEKVGREMQGEELPEPLKKLFGDMKINFYIDDQGNETILNLRTEEGKLKELEVGELEDPDMKFYGDKETVENILKAENPLMALKEGIDAGTVEYKAVGLVNKIKFSFVSMFAKIGSWFGDGEDEGNEITGETITEIVDEEPEVIFDKLVEEEEEAIVAEETGLKRHLVKLIDGGFDTVELKIKVGDIVEWKNLRTNPSFNKALIVGAQKCSKIKSSLFLPGESFEWTFDEKGTCLIVDGIYTTQVMRVIVE